MPIAPHTIGHPNDLRWSAEILCRILERLRQEFKENRPVTSVPCLRRHLLPYARGLFGMA